MTAKQIIVIGAGAGGMMAAGRAAELGANVILLEKTDGPGKKIFISGKSRCNLTNTKDLDDFITMYGENGRFLYSAFKQYFRDDLLAFLKRYGVETKAETDGRLFPASNNAGDVVKAFERYMANNKVQIQTGIHVTDILVDAGHITRVRANSKIYPANAVILATGGSSYPGTGSAGDGYRMATAVGHTIVKLRPALVPLVVCELERAVNMQGVSFHNIRITAYQCTANEINLSMSPNRDSGRGITGKRPRIPVIESRTGDMIITHFGISGPITLLMSLAVVEALEHGPVSVSIDLKPDVTVEELRHQLQENIDRNNKRSYRNILKELLPEKMITPFIEMTGIPSDKRGNQITADKREKLLNLLKSLRFNIKNALPIATAMVTSGGVSLKEIDPRTMQSRLISGLYFCGEVMDIDAETGGYNLQAAFSTGYVAGSNAAAFVRGTSG
ncbi:MAG: NAD(P)/FAD-dependent oxidoreductase [Chloroflexi bacterium]|nr:NAD(P)/FAD-dependent oxidoreductase [Chloroflexota bacterium]